MLAPLLPVSKRASLWLDAWKRLKRNHGAMVGYYIVLVLCLIASLALWISRYTPSYQDYDALTARSTITKAGGGSGWFRVPDFTPKHWLGVDSLGRDIYARLVHGSVISLEVAVISQGVAVVIGMFLGLVAGYYGGWIDALLMGFTEIILAFPFLLLVMTIVAMFGIPSIEMIFVIIGLVGWPSVARVIRAQVLSLKQKEFVEAARALGATDARILLQHLTPNTLAPIIVQVSLGMAGAILSEAGLSFLGFGAQEPTPSWGLMVAKGQGDLDPLWWLSVLPGIAIMLAVFGFNLMGDGLRDALDPRMKT
ncbi:MAG: ABC transporter permease [Candidatus Wallbacteria bacterium]|nr:ABC transporter permease [Candidatus Wallbacteria bacterium]